MQIKLSKSDKRNDPDVDISSLPEEIPFFIVGKPGGIHHARFFSRSYYSTWVAIHILLILEFTELDENKKDQKLSKIKKQLTNNKLIEKLDFFAVYSCIHLDYVFRTHSKQAVINDYRYLININWKELEN